MKNKNLFLLILILSFTATLLFIWHLFFKPPKAAPVRKTGFPPEISLPSPSPLEKNAQLKEIKERLILALPLTTENYFIQYLPKTDQFFILIKSKPYSLYKNEVLSWFKSFGIKDPEKDLPLFFTSSRWVVPE